MKVLIANRGEIATRIIRTCQEMGLSTVAVYSDADRSALHTRYADEAVHLGGSRAADSYLNIPKILEIARTSNSDAVHPGYGFLSENPEFCAAVEDSGILFIGPRPETMKILGDKLSARAAARKAGLPVLPGPDQPISENIPFQKERQKLRYPLLVKAAAGGGGKGIRLVCSEAELESEIELARNEARAAFGDPTIFLEPLVQEARHIEVQILGDGRGRVITIGERECSTQRRHQKLIEEAPAPCLKPAERSRILQAAARLGEKMNYRSLGTVEFLMDRNREIYFIEVNPRIQVEHPVTEMVSGLDLVQEQLKLALSGELDIRQSDISIQGSAIEARILAEDPLSGFIPTTGEVSYLKEPGGLGIRSDNALYQGMLVTADYDSLLAKLIAHGKDRKQAIRKLIRALGEFQIGGVKSTLSFNRRILTAEPFQTADIDTTFLNSFLPEDQIVEEDTLRKAAVAAALHIHQQRALSFREDYLEIDPWKQRAWQEQISS